MAAGGVSTVGKVLITGGGTGGHVYPGLAVAEALLAERPELEIRFAGKRGGIEARLVRRAGYRFHNVPASGLRGMGLVARVRFVVNFVAGFSVSLGLMTTWRPDIVLGTGGYVSAPVLAAAGCCGRVCALQEQNAIPGSTNRLLGRWARRIYLGFEAAKAYLPAERCLVTGNPLRAAFRPGADTAVVDAPSAGEEELKVLVFGGSLGAKTLNDAVAAAAPRWKRETRLALWVQTGAKQRDEVAAALAGCGDRVRVDAFIDEMPAALAWADLAVCRAGAMTLAELAAVGRAAVLVPFPWATDDHQSRNAAECEAAGAAVIVGDAECSGEALAATILEVGADPVRLEAMGAAAARRHEAGAAAVIARDLLQAL